MSLLTMSLTGAALILAVAVLRALALHRLPKETFLVLWGVVLARLLVPVSIPSALSLYGLVRPGGLENIPAGTPAPLPDPGAQPQGTAELLPPLEAAGGAAVHVWWVVWLAGALALGVFFLVSYLRARRKFRTALPVDRPWAAAWLAQNPLRRPIAIRQLDRINTPLTYGLLRPVILLPKTTDWTDEEGLDYVLAHELVHIRRWDGLTKLLLAAALCLHWFNPAVWLFYHLANRDLEITCDGAVLRRFGPAAQGAYARTLLRMEERRGAAAPFYNHFGTHATEERIVAMMKGKKTTLAALLTAVLLVSAITVGFATSPKEEDLLAAVTQAVGRENMETLLAGEKPERLEELSLEQLSQLEVWMMDRLRDCPEGSREEARLGPVAQQVSALVTQGLTAAGAAPGVWEGRGPAKEFCQQNGIMDVLEGFFEAFAVGDFETMKTYCSGDFIVNYFHQNDVLGMAWAKATAIGEGTVIFNGSQYLILVNVQMETTPESALYGETQTSFYLGVKETQKNVWKIDSFATG